MRQLSMFAPSLALGLRSHFSHVLCRRRACPCGATIDSQQRHTPYLSLFFAVCAARWAAQTAKNGGWGLLLALSPRSAGTCPAGAGKHRCTRPTCHDLQSVNARLCAWALASALFPAPLFAAEAMVLPFAKSRVIHDAGAKGNVKYGNLVDPGDEIGWTLANIEPGA